MSQIEDNCKNGGPAPSRNLKASGEDAEHGNVGHAQARCI